MEHHQKQKKSWCNCECWQSTFDSSLLRSLWMCVHIQLTAFSVLSDVSWKPMNLVLHLQNEPIPFVYKQLLLLFTCVISIIFHLLHQIWVFSMLITKPILLISIVYESVSDEKGKGFRIDLLLRPLRRTASHRNRR